jgi:hypothetical protein
MPSRATRRLVLVPLPVDEPDATQRVRRITAATRALKASHTAAGGDLLVALSEVTTPWLLSGVLRIALRLRAFNVLVTNVPDWRRRSRSAPD